MVNYPPPTGEPLTHSQRDVVQWLQAFLVQNEFGQRKINLHLNNLVSKMTEVCTTSEEQQSMTEELDRFVHWQRLHGYWLSFLFQLSMRQLKSPWYLVACRLYSDAQINLNSDLSLSSLENAYNLMVQFLAISNNEYTHRAMNYLIRRLRLIYAYYRFWYTPRPYREINPLTEHLYSEKTRIDLVIAFPELNKPRSSLVPDDYLRIIKHCWKPNDVFYRIVARRFLGCMYQGQKKWDAAQEQYNLGLKEAKQVSLDTEIGHFYRLNGYALSQIGQLEGARQQFERAFSYESHPGFSYWQALSARELGDVRIKMANSEINHERSRRHITAALKAYRAGRWMLEEHIGRGVVPIARGIKQQLFRSFTDNALQASIYLKSHHDTLAELEAAGPRYATEILAEGRAASKLQSDVYIRYRQARAVFHGHLTYFDEKDSLDEDFSKYLDSVRDNREARHLYIKHRNVMTPAITRAQISDDIAQKATTLHLPEVMFLLFHVGQGQTVVLLLDAGSGQVVAEEIIKYGEQDWKENHKAYERAIKAAKNLPNPAVGMCQALDDLLDIYETWLGSLLTKFQPFLEGRDLKIFPRLFMNQVPLHALTVGTKRLIEFCNVSYAQTLGSLLQVHHNKTTPAARTLAMIYDVKRAPIYEGTRKKLKNEYKNDLHVLRNPSWQEFKFLAHNKNPNDILFACHGQYNPDDPVASFLRFGEKEEVSFFKIFSELDLTGSKCVSLGACESGLGRTIITAEYLGLPIAFFAAGVRYVISSLWQVNQLAAAILLSYHYELCNKHTIISALNEAQRVIMKMSQDQVLQWVEIYLPDRLIKWEPIIRQMENPPFSHPYYWAGFYVAGDT